MYSPTNLQLLGLVLIFRVLYRLETYFFYKSIKSIKHNLQVTLDILTANILLDFLSEQDLSERDPDH